MAEIVYVRDANGNLIQTTIEDLREDRLEELEEENKNLKEENETLREELISRIRQPQSTPYGKGVTELMEENDRYKSQKENILMGKI